MAKTDFPLSRRCFLVSAAAALPVTSVANRSILLLRLKPWNRYPPCRL